MRILTLWFAQFTIHSLFGNFLSGGSPRYSHKVHVDDLGDLEDYIQREDPKGMDSDTYAIFEQLARLHNLQYPPLDAEDATTLYRKLSVLV